MNNTAHSNRLLCIACKHALLTMLCLLPWGVQAQNNAYKINDEVYQVYLRSRKHLREDDNILRIDTMLQLARKHKDVKGECLTLSQYTSYWLYAHDDIVKMKQAHQKACKFIINTPYKQYIFDSWNRIIHYYNDHQMTEEALTELNAYQKEAYRLNNEYGIGAGARALATIYYSKEMLGEAVKELEKAVDYYEGIGNIREAFSIYNALATVYSHLNEQQKIPALLKKMEQEAVTDERKRSLTYHYLDYYVDNDQWDKAKELIEKDSLISNIANLPPSNLVNYVTLLQNYYTHFNQHEKLKSLMTAFERVAPASEHKWNMLDTFYNHAQDYEKVVEMRDKQVKNLTDIIKQSNLEKQSSLFSQFDLYKVEMERNNLALANNQLQLLQTQNDQELLKAYNDSNRLALSNKEQQMLRQHAINQQQQNELAHQQREKKSIELKARQEEMMQQRYYAIALIVFVFVVIYNIRHAFQDKRLKRERLIAEQARQSAERSTKLKTFFLQNMSHDIRTPLNAIVGFNELLNDPDSELEPEERKEFLQLINTNTEMLITLINDIVDLSKLESGNYVKTLSEEPANEMCHNLAATLQQRTIPGVQLHFDKPDTDVNLYTDKQRLQQALTNFLTNACKYTDKGSITLSYATVGANEVCFSVSDTGCGIPANKAEHIFERFTMLEQSKKGTGLGLSICKSIADMLGGRVWLDTTYTQGARFCLQIPIRQKENQ